ncbi:hypothetical protein FRC03_007026 [Tulasnella sp. 419]|nr:hypothetical protein FRC03_007026 [Tulasnella sp. 419]
MLIFPDDVGQRRIGRPRSKEIFVGSSKNVILAQDPSNEEPKKPKAKNQPKKRCTKVNSDVAGGSAEAEQGAGDKKVNSVDNAGSIKMRAEDGGAVNMVINPSPACDMSEQIIKEFIGVDDEDHRSPRPFLDDGGAFGYPEDIDEDLGDMDLHLR